MKIDLPSKFDAFKPSTKLLNLISYIENNSDSKVTIKFRDEYNQYPNKAFYSEEETGKVSLHIATELFEDLDNLEQSIAHEAGHALLSKVKKYPSITLNTDNYYKKININTIRNAFEDILINILLKSYGFNSHGKSFYTSLNSEIYSLKNRMDPYFEKNEELKETFIFNRIILALGYYHMIETLQGIREILQIYGSTGKFVGK